MAHKINLEWLEQEAAKLSPQEQLELVKKLVRRLVRKRGMNRKPLDWRQLYGAGEGLWPEEDAQEYVNKLREDQT